MTAEAATVVLGPGGFHFGSGELRISTLLGSCVAITFWHPYQHLGGMCHYLLPRRRESGWNGFEELDGRYADEAMLMFQRAMTRAGTVPADYQVKIFGGGHQFFDGHAAGGSDIPARNVEAGIDLLQDLGLTTIARHVGGAGPRVVILNVETGDVWLRHAPAAAVLEGTAG